MESLRKIKKLGKDRNGEMPGWGIGVLITVIIVLVIVIGCIIASLETV